MCPGNASHIVNPTNITEIVMKTAKLITPTDNPYFIRTEFLECDTTTGNVIINLPDATCSNRARLYIQRVAGSNNVILNARGSDLIDGNPTKIINNNIVYEMISSAGNWSQCLVDNNDIEAIDVHQILPQVLMRECIPRTHNKGDIEVGDDRSQTIFPVGLNGQVIIADSTKNVGMKWANLPNLAPTAMGRNWIFGNAQSGGSGNVGLTISCNKDTPVLMCKFMKDNNQTDIISSIEFLLYCNKDLIAPLGGLSLKLFESNFGDASATPILHGSSNQTVNSATLSDSPQRIIFTFASPITITKNTVEVFLENKSFGAASVSVWQMIVHA
jgi:hypothetical protein